MGKIVVSTNVTLDGVVQDPDGKEGFAHGGWFGECGGKDLGPWSEMMTGEALKSEALLLGRKTDAWFASRWLDRPGKWADRLNALPKYVVSSTAKTAKWSNATVLNDAVADVSKLKERIQGDIMVYASYGLVGTLLEHRLVDEFRLTVFPIVLGAGTRLFGESRETTPLRLTRTQRIGEGLSMVTYEVTRAT